jgi:DNA primase catalytic core
MARIPEVELERLKREVSLQRLVEASGVELSRHGQDLIGLCPLHNDKSPSLVVSPKKNLWHCLGACQTGGSVIDWVMKTEGVSFRHAVELLRTGALPHSVSSGQLRQRSTVRKLEPVVERCASDQMLLGQVIDYYHATLKESPEALAYLDKRGLRSPEIIDRFRLGFANRTLGYRIPGKDRVAGAELRGRLQEIGILRKSGHEHFRGSLVIPVLGEHGEVLEVYGRKVSGGLRKGTPNHLYLPGPHRGVWNMEALSVSEEIILCESLIDALTFWCAGLHNVTASYGIEGFTVEHLEAFEAHGVERVLIAYDRDAAGDRAAQAVADKLMAKGLGCYRVQFPRGMDANEYALSVQPADKALRVALGSAQWLGKGAPPVPHPTSAGVQVQVSSAVSAASSPSPLSPLAAGSSAAEKSGAPALPASTESTPALPASTESTPATAASAAPASTVDPAEAPVLDSNARRNAGFGVNAEVTDSEVVIRFGDRRWRIRGLSKNMSYELLRVNVLCGRNESFHVDTFDLYSARHRSAFLEQAAAELGVERDVLKRDLGKVLLELERLQEQQIRDALEPEAQVPQMSDAERAAALALLRDPRLLDRILGDFERCGVVGEETNKLMGYLAAVSRKLEQPLAVIIQSSSAAGKSSLMESILAFMPDEERVKYSAMTGQSLFYMGETNLKHKILAIVEETGAERAAYALKLLQSEGELMIASTGKDPETGRLVTHEYRVEGPVMIFLTTTAIEIDDELLNRCLVLTVDEDREQTQAIHRMQRRAHTLEGLLERKERAAVLALHRNAQRLLMPVSVVNPYAERLTFLDDRTRTRRDHEKYLSLMESIAVLHQHQRPKRTAVHDGQVLEYVDVTVDDIALANRLAHEVLGRSLDELPPQTRRLLTLIDSMVGEACKGLEMDRCDFRFTRRQLREHTGWGHTQLKTHLHRLEELEYLLVHRSGRGQRFVYELLYNGEGQDGSRFLPGLIDVEHLRTGTYDVNRSGQNVNRSGPGRPDVGAVSGGGRTSENGTEAEDEAGAVEIEVLAPWNAHQGPVEKSYVPRPVVAVARAK